MSYITLEVKAHREWYEDDYLSLGGVYATDKKQDNPLALIEYLENHQNLRTVHLHFDNDEIGRKAAEQIKNALQDRYDGSDLKTIKAYLSSYRGEGALPRYPPPLPCESGGGH